MQAEFLQEQQVWTVDQPRSWQTNCRIWTLCTKQENVLLLYSILEKLGHPWVSPYFGRWWGGRKFLRTGAIMVMSCWHHSRITSCPSAPTSPLMNSFFLVEERQKSRKRTVSSTWNRCLAVSTTVRILLMTLLLFCCLLLNGLSCILPGRTSEPCLPGAPLPSMSSYFQTPKKGLEIQSFF